MSSSQHGFSDTEESSSTSEIQNLNDAPNTADSKQDPPLSRRVSANSIRRSSSYKPERHTTDIMAQYETVENNWKMNNITQFFRILELFSFVVGLRLNELGFRFC